MALNTTLNVSVAGNGLNISLQKQIASNGSIPVSRTLPAAQAGDTDGAATNIIADSAGHGVITGDTIDVYWTIAGVKYARYSVTVGTVSGTTIPVSGGTGDALVVSQAVTFMVQVPTDFVVTGNDLVGLFLQTPVQGTILVQSSGPTTELAFVADEADLYRWFSDSGVANPVAGDSIIRVTMTHADDTQARTLTALGLYN